MLPVEQDLARRMGIFKSNFFGNVSGLLHLSQGNRIIFLMEAAPFPQRIPHPPPSPPPPQVPQRKGVD